MNFDLFNDFGSDLGEFCYLLLATLRNVLYVTLSGEGIIGKSMLILVLICVIGMVCASAKDRFASDDDPFKFVEQR